MAFVVGSIVAGSVAAVGGIVQAVGGGIKAKNARIAAEKAQVKLDKQQNAFSQLDTSNPYRNMENTMEDLTVNTQAAEFGKQEQMQQQANVMGQMSGAAGSSGIAALAQTMANQGSLDAQKNSASIAEQEAANQKTSTAESSRIQDLQIGEDVRISDLERAGELKSREMEAGKIKGLMGLAAGDVSSAQALQAQGTAAQMAGVGDITAGVGQAAGGVYDYSQREQ